MTGDATFGRRAPSTRQAAPPPRGTRPEPLAFMSTPIEPELKAEWAAKAAPRPAPVLTLAIIAGLTIIFAAEYRFNVGPIQGMAPGSNSLIALGALSRKLALDAGEPWRLVTAVLLHLNPAHIIGNAIVLFMAGATLERLVGRAWLGATFVVSGLAGSLATLGCDPAGQLGVGASGAIMGLVSAAFVCSFHPHATGWRRSIHFACARVAIPALIPFSSIQGGPNIGYNCHGGGLLAGLAMGLMIRLLWPVTEVHPGQRRFAASIGWGGLALAALSFTMVALHYPAYAAVGERYAASLPPVTDQAMRTPGFGDQTLAFVRLYPHDPRTHLLRSLYLLNTKDLDQAEGETRAALAEPDALTNDFPGLAPKLHLLLAAILLEQGRRSAAETEAAPWCVQHYRERPTELLREQLLGAGLCGGWQATGPTARAVPDRPAGSSVVQP
ncbi:MAG TPA: rhomboid family intramembrane serine protease [Caulobacteraceae bacterium]|jgi:rhomboid protease GluP